MKTLKEACVPRSSVFDPTRRDSVLDLTDLLQHRINAADFFEENYPTEGMQTLLREAFRRFSGHSAHGVFLLTQAMGGGKTHNLIATGLLAQHPELRAQVMGQGYQANHLGKVRVVGFSGRERPPLGIWGDIAEQLGKKEMFGSYYSPLAAPGQTAWVNLLKGEPLLILLDELPPYLQDARSKAIGNSDLAQVTTAALANLLVAINKDELSNVCVIITDLKATYEGGTEQLNKALRDFENEAKRSALPIEPVRANNDELYHILRRRLFENLPGEADIDAVAQAYAKAVKDARQMGITSASPESMVQQVRDSYPFHPALRDLYARFRENPGFQQTRGILRMMRVMMSGMYDPQHGWADQRHLVSPFDIDLNDQEAFGQISTINSALTNAVSHDVASGGNALAERKDTERGGNDVRDVAKLILVSSLANVPNATLGLSQSEIVHALCAPGRDVSKIPQEAIGALAAEAWYLHQDRSGRFFFKNTQNVVAKLQTLAKGYTPEQCTKELRTRLTDMFLPTLKDCYQDLYVLPSVDDIQIKPDRVALVLYRPHPGQGIHPDLKAKYDDLEYKNRVCFLSGQRETLESLTSVAAEAKAIETILAEMDSDGVPDKDPQRQEAVKLRERIQLRLLAAARETFTVLFYPSTGKDLRTTDFLMEWKDNAYRGENQVRAALLSKMKFTDDVASDVFKQKVEQRLFTQGSMQWSEIKRRAATDTAWQWHHPEALEKQKTSLVTKSIWREEGGNYVNKGPFATSKTTVRVQRVLRDDETGRTTLKITPVDGDHVHWEVGAVATPASALVTDFKDFQTDELEVSFLCVDTTGQHETGEPVTWKNEITLKHRIFQAGKDRKVELKVAPDAVIRYTTDGSNPTMFGGKYDGPFVVTTGASLVQAVADKAGVVSPILKVPMSWDKDPEAVKVEPLQPATWKRAHPCKGSKATYEFLARLKKHGAKINGLRLYLETDGAKRTWAEFNLDVGVGVDSDQIDLLLDQIRGMLGNGKVEVDLEAQEIVFLRGQDLLDWVADEKTELKPGEVSQ